MFMPSLRNALHSHHTLSPAIGLPSTYALSRLSGIGGKTQRIRKPADGGRWGLDLQLRYVAS